jgi:hypothetical protein
MKCIIDTALIDIKESQILQYDEELLKILLVDRSSNENIIWATDNYTDLGPEYAPQAHITISSITRDDVHVIQPRVKKSKAVQEYRSKDKAEVFTPSWICNKQNNLIDNAYFGRSGVFNEETEDGWISTNKVEFLESENWQDYIKEKRLEITCGEAPYIVSRYDATTGELIAPLNRVGILDRKFRVIHENTEQMTFQTWFKWIKLALQSTYGYEWQGDNLLLARENILLTYIDFYQLKFNGSFPSNRSILEVAEIISWNIWQMDGIKMVIPDTCGDREMIVKDNQLSLFDEPEERIEVVPCPGCKTNNPHIHNGIQCKIMNWYSGYKNDKVGEVFFHTLIS